LDATGQTTFGVEIMIISSPQRSLRRGFTLVEMLVVIAIIGILAGLISVAAVKAIAAAKRAVISIEISELDQALKNYQNKFGEYPPDGTDTTISTTSNGVPDVFLRHFQRVFPRADLTSNPEGQKQLQALQAAAQNYNPTTALAFWLGGVPENNSNSKSRLIGFSQNPKYPLETTSTSRIGPFFDFDFNRLDVPLNATNQIFRTYTAKGVNNGYPYVYFRAELRQKGTAPTQAPPFIKGKEVYLTKNLHAVKALFFNSPNSVAIPTNAQLQRSVKAYFDVTSQNWANPTSYQIIFCGLDNAFGTGNLYNTGRWNTTWGTKPANFFYEYSNKNVVGGYDTNNYDEQTNFLKGTVIGDDLP
jgi:prepilin-type N-terminal cleavage/methylation domain-containing protein